MPKIIKYIIYFLGFLLLFFGVGELLRRKIGGFAGSYPFVEYWDIKASEKEVIEAIKELKSEDPSLQPPNEIELVGERNSEYDWNSKEMKKYNEDYRLDSLTPLPPKTKANTKNDYWLFIDFYYADTREIVHTWTRPALDSTITTFALVSINRRLINSDYWYLANLRAIDKFKEKIVDRVQEKINKKKREEFKP